jgi:hypothetical protein
VSCHVYTRAGSQGASMTLNITVVARDIVYQCSDFRLSSYDGRAGKYVPLDRYSQKQVFITTFDWTATVTFTGIGLTPRVDVADWLSQFAAECSPDAQLSDLSQYLLSGESWLSTVRTDDKRHTFVAAGFIGDRPFLMVVSNYQDVYGVSQARAGAKLQATYAYPTSVKPSVLVTGRSEAVSKETRLELRRRVRAAAARGVMHDYLAEINAAVALSPKAEGTVSPECFTADLRPDGQSEHRPHGVGDWDGYMPPQFAKLLSRYGLALNPALDENGNPKRIKFVAGSSARGGPGSGPDLK